uniref:Uncharacterized protein n=1 Tax=Siphoviridae sp. ctD4R19 TaxID=2823568 RepID=A0A8S5L6G3_9CAUD|nr:MAG TPA: hypothetical protein [Siphoviridae sp. ctD4R19]
MQNKDTKIFDNVNKIMFFFIKNNYICVVVCYY